ncbi:uncharacterized protein LOC116685020 [Etheostoma spectabile]|uniref:uncharacterized protein LOC116685020 n=1 Tax=Etheostoma spectabile TaxID=54343 RepID=UPI0013AF1FF6|nr:uncharacterized protein LOC116685020 [Etheostoma spectabile]
MAAWRDAPYHESARMDASYHAAAWRDASYHTAAWRDASYHECGSQAASAASNGGPGPPLGRVSPSLPRAPRVQNQFQLHIKVDSEVMTVKSLSTNQGDVPPPQSLCPPGLVRQGPLTFTATYVATHPTPVVPPRVSNCNQRAWVGLSGDSWRWSLSDPSFYKPGETDFTRWGSGEPDVKYSEKACVAVTNNGDWFDYICNDRGFHTVACPVCADVRGSNVTFVHVNTTISWTEAQSYCRANYTDLASVRNMADIQKMRAVIAGVPLQPWIGLSRDPWKWSDGSSSSFSFWKTGQPDIKNGNQTCVAADFSQSGAWEDWPCDMERAFICYGPVVPVSKKVMKVKFVKKGDGDLNESDVMAAMLNQLQQKLRAQGLDHNIKLSWRKQADGEVFHKEDQKTNKRRRKRDEL